MDDVTGNLFSLFYPTLLKTFFGKHDRDLLRESEDSV